MQKRYFRPGKVQKGSPIKNFVIIGSVLLLVGLLLFLLTRPAIRLYVPGEDIDERLKKYGLRRKMYSGYAGYGRFNRIGDTCVTACWLKKDKLAFFLFLNDKGEGESSIPSSDTSRDGIKTYIYEQTMRDKRKVVIKYKKNSGEVSINDNIYYLKDGKVFLGAIYKKPIEVKQLNVSLPKELEQNQEYTKDDVIRFIESHREIRKLVAIEREY